MSDVVLHLPGGELAFGDVVQGVAEDWSFAAPQLTVNVSDRGRRLEALLDPTVRLQDQFSATFAATTWRATAIEYGPTAKVTFDHHIVDGLRSKKGPVSAKKSMDRPQFAKSLLTLRGEAPWRVVCPEAKKGGKPPKLDAVATSQVRKQQAERDVQRAPGFADGAAFKIKGAAATSEQKKVLSQALAAADDVDAGAKPTLALIAALIVEDRARNRRVGHSTSTGSLQVLSSTAAAVGVDPMNVSQVAREFLRKGFGKYRPDGAIALARKNPGWTAGRIAQACQQSAHPERYDQALPEARAIVAAWSGNNKGGSDSGSDDRATFQVEESGDYWEASGKLAEDVYRRRFIAAGDVVYWVAESLLMKSRPYATISRNSEGVRLKPASVDELLFVDKCTAELVLPAGSGGDVIGRQILIVDSGGQNGQWLAVKASRSRRDDRFLAIDLERPRNPLAEPKREAAQPGTTGNTSVTRSSNNNRVTRITTAGGAKGIVDQAFKIAQQAGGSTIYVGSSLRPGSTTSSGNPSDHGANSAQQAARDIGKRGTNLLTGPPTPEMDRAVAAVCAALGVEWAKGSTLIKTFTWKGYRVQLIWRTPRYGGHEGHLHIGVRRLVSA